MSAAAHIWQPGWQVWRATPEALLHVFCAGDAAQGPTALITAGVHGDEYEGPAALADLARKLDSSKLHGRVLLVPVVNPLARATGTRITQEDGKNLARCFPGAEQGTVTERLAHAVYEHLLRPADFLIDLHSGGVEYRFLPVAGFYGEIADNNASLQAARIFGLPALWQLPPTDGVLSYEATRLGKTAIGHEYLGGGELSLAGAEAYRDGVERCLRLWSILRETPDAASIQDAVATAIYTGDWQMSAASGLFIASVQLGGSVAEGDVLAHIYDERGEVLQTIFAQSAGTVLGLRCKAHVEQGKWAVLLGRRHDGI